MYRESAKLFLKLRAYVGMVVAGMLLVDLFNEKMSSSSGGIVAGVILMAYLAYATHSEILLHNSAMKALDSRKVFRFALRSLGLGAAFVIPGMVAATVVWASLGAPDLAGPASLGFVIASMGVMAILFPIVFALFGTLLPAYVVGEHQGISTAFLRGRHQFWRLAGRLLSGPVVVYALSFVLTLALLPLLDLATPMLGANLSPNIPVILHAIVSHGIEALTVVMTAWVLSMGYLADPDPDLRLAGDNGLGQSPLRRVDDPL